MYETPTLIPIGKAENVVRGVFNNGYDLDTLYIIENMEFQDDPDAAQA